MKKLLSVILVSALFISACAPAAQPGPAPAETPAPAVTQAAPQAATTPEIPSTQAERTSAEGSMVIAAALETPSVAPARHNTFVGALKNHMTHDQLFRSQFDTMEPTPLLVSEWRALSDVLFEFTLHEGIMFHNGEEMTADDVEASFHYVRQYPDGRAAHLSAQAIEVIDRYTFTLYTGEPNAALFFDLLGQSNSIMPASLISSGHDFLVEPVGSGPYMFREWNLGDSISFTAFDDYWNPERAAKIRDVTWRIIPEGSSRTIALETGEADYVMEVAFPDIPRLQEHPNVEVFMRPGTTFNMLLLNHNRPQFENVYARQAINMAIDQDALVAVGFDGLVIPTRAQLPTVFAGTTEAGVAPFDPEGARALLAQHNIDPASLAFDMIASTEERRRMGEVVQAQMADIGITTTITMMDHASSLVRLNNDDYETGFGQWGASFLISTLRGVLLHADEAPNRSNFYHTEINELIHESIATIDVGERNAIFERISGMANEQFVNVPTHNAMVIQAFNSNLVVPEVNGVGIFWVNMMHWVQ